MEKKFQPWSFIQKKIVQDLKAHPLYIHMHFMVSRLSPALSKAKEIIMLWTKKIGRTDKQTERQITNYYRAPADRGPDKNFILHTPSLKFAQTIIFSFHSKIKLLLKIRYQQVSCKNQEKILAFLAALSYWWYEVQFIN